AVAHRLAAQPARAGCVRGGPGRDDAGRARPGRDARAREALPAPRRGWQNRKYPGGKVREYSPKRRTAVVFTGMGTTGAYHAGVLRALDESGVKIDLVVGSGVGAITAAFAAVGGGAKLHVALSLVGISFAIIALPVALGLVLGLLFPLLLIADRASPGSASRALQALWVAPEAMSGPYLAAQAVPVFALAMVAIVVLGLAYWRRRTRLAEA